MKIEIDTNEDSYADWLRIQKFVEDIYQMARANRKKPVVITPDPDLVIRTSTPYG